MNPWWSNFWEGQYVEDEEWVAGPGYPVHRFFTRLNNWRWAKSNKVRLWWHVKHSRKYLIVRLDQADREIVRARADADNWVVNLQLRCEASGAIPKPTNPVDDEEYIRVMNGGAKAARAAKAALKQDYLRAMHNVNVKELKPDE